MYEVNYNGRISHDVFDAERNLLAIAKFTRAICINQTVYVFATDRSLLRMTSP